MKIPSKVITFLCEATLPINYRRTHLIHFSSRLHHLNIGVFLTMITFIADDRTITESLISLVKIDKPTKNTQIIALCFPFFVMLNNKMLARSISQRKTLPFKQRMKSCTVDGFYFNGQKCVFFFEIFLAEHLYV